MPAKQIMKSREFVLRRTMITRWAFYTQKILLIQFVLNWQNTYTANLRFRIKKIEHIFLRNYRPREALFKSGKITKPLKP